VYESTQHKQMPSTNIKIIQNLWRKGKERLEGKKGEEKGGDGRETKLI
jgi:hypothetical protein